MAAAIKAVETLDACLARITDAILAVNGSCLITADHGNVEQMLDPESGQAMTSHTTGPVPLVCVSKEPVKLLDGGALCDVAPSLLTLMHLPIPPEMSGHSLVSPS
jgi:2,3-bisphosphoglycerate-independent phosphoglycerate mutase